MFSFFSSSKCSITCLNKKQKALFLHLYHMSVVSNLNFNYGYIYFSLSSLVLLSVIEMRIKSGVVQICNQYVDGTGTIDAIIKMIRYEGLSSFYKGMSTKIVQSVFAASVLFMVKEEILKAYILTASKFKQVLSTTSSLVKQSPHAS